MILYFTDILIQKLGIIFIFFSCILNFLLISFSLSLRRSLNSANSLSLYVNEIIPQGLFLLNPTWWTWFRDERRERIEIAFIKLIKKTDFCLVREYFFLTKIPSRVPHARFSHALYLFIIFYLFVYLFFSVSHSFFRRLKKISGHIRVDICTIAFIINLSTAFHTFSRCN